MSYLTWTLFTQRAVSVAIRDPDTPGGFRFCMAFRPASNSATADDMAAFELALDYWPRGNIRS